MAKTKAGARQVPEVATANYNNNTIAGDVTGVLGATLISRLQNRGLNIVQPIPSYGDTFDNNVLDIDKWLVTTNNGTITVEGTELKLNVTSHPSTLRFENKTAINLLNGQHIDIDISTLNWTADNNEFLVIGLTPVGYQADYNIYARINRDGTLLFTAYGSTVSPQLNISTYKYLRFARNVNNNNLHFYASTDGNIWTDCGQAGGGLYDLGNLLGISIKQTTTSSGTVASTVNIRGISSNAGGTDALADNSLLWFKTANNRFENVSLADLRTALAIPASGGAAIGLNSIFPIGDVGNIADYTWVNQQGSTVAKVGNGFRIRGKSDGNHSNANRIMGLVKPFGAGNYSSGAIVGNWTVTLGMIGSYPTAPTSYSGDIGGMGLILRDSVTSKVQYFGLTFYEGYVLDAKKTLSAYNFSDAESLTGSPFDAVTDIKFADYPVYFFRVSQQASGGTVYKKFYISKDGLFWRQIGNVADNDYLSPDQYGVGFVSDVGGGNIAGVKINLFSLDMQLFSNLTNALIEL